MIAVPRPPRHSYLLARSMPTVSMGSNEPVRCPMSRFSRANGGINVSGLARVSC
jgi:hypothetical protein